MKNTKIFLVVGALFTVLGCSQGSLSERDARLEQLRLQADAKRRELQQVVGVYTGKSDQPSGVSHEIYMALNTVDVPTPVEGQPEPVMMPALSGFLRFYLGTMGASEYFAVTVDKAGFDANANRIEIAGSHPEYKEFYISFSRREPELTGTWTAPSMSLSGTMSLKRE